MDTTPNLADMLKMLTPLQLDYVAARINTQTDKAAADKLGIHPQGFTICRCCLRRLRCAAVARISR